MIRTFIVTGLLLGLAALSFAQGKPDFSGEWILDRKASTISQAAAAIQSGVVQIEHRDPMFRYQVRFITQNGPIVYAYELLTDGREIGATQQGVTSVSSLRWEAEALVLNSRIQRPDGEVRISFRYELIDSGRRLRGIERLRGGGQDQDNTWIFDRH